MDKFDEEMDKLAKSYEDRADGILEEAQRKAEESSRGTILGNLGTIILFNLVILGMAALTFWLGNKAYQFSNNGETTTGTVTELAESTTEDGCCVYSPVVEYMVDGQKYTFESMNASDPPSYRIGQQIEVIYNQASPSKGAINSWTELWLVPGILGLTTLILGVVLNWIAIAKISKGESVLKFDD
jgi:hypothetical protein